MLLVGAACETEPGQPDLECLFCHVLCEGTEHVLPATVPVQQTSLGCGPGGRKTPANPGPAVVSWLSTRLSLIQVYFAGFISRETLREKKTALELWQCVEKRPLCARVLV